MWCYAILGLVVAILLYFEVFTLRKAYIRDFPCTDLIYLEFKTSLKVIGNSFEELQKKLSSLNVQMKDQEVLGIYFDEPSKNSVIRYALGISAASCSKEKIAELLSKGFSMKTLPRAKSSYTFMIFRNTLSFFLISSYWKKICNHVSGLKLNNLVSAGVEVYSWERSPKLIEMYLPIDKEAPQFQFSSL